MAAARVRRPLDMMPLLDIFMVVLFVFATIQEGKLSATTEDAEKLQNDLQEASARLAELEQQLEDANPEQTRAALAEQTRRAQEAEAERDQQREELQSLAELEREAREKLEDVSQELRKQLATAIGSDEQVRKAEILEKLLDQHSVFEIEIRGVPDPTRGIINQCCFRADPRSGTWQACGEVPPETAALNEWFRQGAGGLERTLRATKGGNAMTIIRHDAGATHRIGQKVETLIRSQVPEQRVYDEGIAVIEMACRR